MQNRFSGTQNVKLQAIPGTCLASCEEVDEQRTRSTERMSRQQQIAIKTELNYGFQLENSTTAPINTRPSVCVTGSTVAYLAGIKEFSVTWWASVNRDRPPDKQLSEL